MPVALGKGRCKIPRWNRYRHWEEKKKKKIKKCLPVASCVSIVPHQIARKASSSLSAFSPLISAPCPISLAAFTACSPLGPSGLGACAALQSAACLRVRPRCVPYPQAVFLLALAVLAAPHCCRLFDVPSRPFFLFFPFLCYWPSCSPFFCSRIC